MHEDFHAKQNKTKQQHKVKSIDDKRKHDVEPGKDSHTEPESHMQHDDLRVRHGNHSTDGAEETHSEKMS